MADSHLDSGVSNVVTGSLAALRGDRRSGGGSWVVGQFRVESTIVRAIAVNVAVEVIMLRNPMRPAAILALIAVSASLAPCVADPVELSTFIALARPAHFSAERFVLNLTAVVLGARARSARAS